MNVVFRLAQVPAELAAGGPLGPVDAAADHPAAFVFMTILLLMFAVGRVAKETRTSVKWSSFLHLWMVAYLVTLAFLMSVTTAMALVVLIDEKGQPRANFVPPSFLSMAAVVAGVFGFEFLFRKFIIGFGENQSGFGNHATEFCGSGGCSHVEKGSGRVGSNPAAIGSRRSPPPTSS
jgi:hypothetical protein